MKIFVVTAGKYDDYYIVGVAATKETADGIVNRYNHCKGLDKGDYGAAEYEEYETDNYEPLRTNRLWRCQIKNRPSKKSEINVCESPEYGEPVGQVSEGITPLSLYTYVYAVNEEDAIKLASDIFAEYQAKGEGLV